MKKINSIVKTLEVRDYILAIVLLLCLYNSVQISIISSYARQTHVNSMTVINTLNDEVQLNAIDRKTQGELLRDVIIIKMDLNAIKTKLRNEDIDSNSIFN